jgi:hypothetical protein
VCNEQHVLLSQLFRHPFSHVSPKIIRHPFSHVSPKIISTNNIATGMVRGGRKYAFNPPKVRFQLA